MKIQQHSSWILTREKIFGLSFAVLPGLLDIQILPQSYLVRIAVENP